MPVTALGTMFLRLNAQTGEVSLQRTGRFILCGATYIQGSIQKGDPNATIDVMGAIVIRIPPNPNPNPGISTHELRLGQYVVPLSAEGNLQDSGFSLSGGTTLMLPAGTKNQPESGCVCRQPLQRTVSQLADPL